MQFCINQSLNAFRHIKKFYVNLNCYFLYYILLTLNNRKNKCSCENEYVIIIPSIFSPLYHMNKMQDSKRFPDMLHLDRQQPSY